MKKVITGKELQDNILKSINLLCDTVKQTLGPIGNNILVDHSNFSPFITNDGVTIAKNIESDDLIMGAILEIIKEASIKTDEVVGDGTTTTLVLLKSLYIESLEYINQGKSPIVLKNDLENVLEDILKNLDNQKRKATSTDLKHIACISSGNEILGDLAYQVYKTVKNKNAISIKEISDNNLSVDYLKGYICKTTLASLFFLKDSLELKFKDSYVLLINGSFINLESISFLINDILISKRDLIIIANNFDDYVIQELVSLAINKCLNICLFTIDEYGIHTYEVLKDIALLTNAVIIEQNETISSNAIGFIKNASITSDYLRLDFKQNSDTKNYLNKLKRKLKDMESDLEKEFYEKRIAMFLNGTAQIKLGAPTKIECLEKRMHLEDALCALSVSNMGILPGGGISLLKVASKLDRNNEASDIWFKVLQKPFETIYQNAGQDYLDIKRKVVSNDFKSLYNITSNSWEFCDSTHVIDPFLVIKESLQNALSIANMLLTTNSLVINEYKNNKENEYNNW